MLEYKLILFKKGRIKLEKRVFLKRVEDILNTKDWSGIAKSYIKGAAKFVYENYAPHDYYKVSIFNYLERFLYILNNMKDFKVVEFADFGLEVEYMDYFRSQVRVANGNDGTLDIVDGQFVPAVRGRYSCPLSGYADLNKRNVYLLSESDKVFRHLNIVHELTHLDDGKYSFPVGKLPFSADFRKMCIEGKAVFHETLFGTQIEDGAWCDNINDEKHHLQIYSDSCSYPLYEILYKLLILIFGVETIEKMSKNTDAGLNMIETLKAMYPNLPVYEIYAHFVYILAMFDDNSKSFIKNTINIFRKSQYSLFSQEQANYKNYIRALRELHRNIMQAQDKASYNEFKKIFIFALKETQASKEKMLALKDESLTYALMDMCVKNGDLIASFDFLINVANMVIFSSKTVDESMAKELGNIRNTLIEARELGNIR